MINRRVFMSPTQARRVAAGCVLSAAVIGTAACAGQAPAAPQALVGATHNATPTSASATTGATGTSSASASPSTSAASTTSASKQSTSVAPAARTTYASTPSCTNQDVKISWGYGGMGQPQQYSAVVFTNASDHTCTLHGYPGAAIKDDGKVFDAARVLNGFRGDLPPLTSPPLVTLAPGATSYAVIEWKLRVGSESCYPTGSGSIEITAPNTTNTVVLSTNAIMGTKGICSGLEINPVVPGTFGFPAST